ncbi:MAG: molybdopterin-guanine dinucleotide biosynthesis protein B [Dehalococcoidia bacterium]|jgi:FdhD protein|nr:molybdopterin-guanine dinucleotide biosynthesis protein B [Dehalococcoidia bacterium]
MAEEGRLPVLAVVGPSGAGKTTVLAALIGELARRGYRVAAIKHSHHPGLMPDTPGKDSHRLWEAGAQAVALVGPDLLALRWRGGHGRDLPQLLTLLRGMADIILVEGYSAQPIPRIEVWRQGLGPPPRPAAGRILAMVGHAPSDWEGPTFQPWQTAQLADLVERELGLRRP